MTNTSKSVTSSASTLVWNLASVAAGVVLSVMVSLNTINNTDGLVLVGLVIAGGVCGAIVSALALALAGDSPFRRFATRALLFCMAAAVTILVCGFGGMY